MKLERVERLNLGLSAGAVAASFVLTTPHFATSLAVGALLEAVNFGSMYRGAQRFFAGDFGGAGLWVVLFATRFVLLAVGIFVTISVGAHPVALVIGLSIAMPAVLIDSWIHRPAVVDHETLPMLAPDDPSWDRYSVWRAAEVERRAEADLAAETDAKDEDPR
jgi:hypothetical protein